MASFEIPLQELKDNGVDVEKLINLLKLIDAPPECTDIGRVISTLHDSARVIKNIAPASTKLNELVSLTQSLLECGHLLPRLKAGEDDNPMFGRYADYPVYSLFAQRGSSDNDYAAADRFRIFNGLLLATAWISNTPIPRNYDKFLEELRIIRRDNNPNEILSIVENARSIQRIINSFSSKSQNILKSNFRNLAIKIQKDIPLKQNSSVSLDDIESKLLGDAEAGEVEVETFREILRVIGCTLPSVNQINRVFHALEELVPIVESFDNRFTDVWPRWTKTIRKVRDILHDAFTSSALVQPEIADFKAFMLISCLTAKTDKKVHSGLVPAKAILLVGHYIKYFEYHNSKFEWSYRNSSEQFLADVINRIYTQKDTVYRDVAEKYLPAWTSSSPTQWKETFLKNAETATIKEGTYYGRKFTPDKHQFIHTIRRILIFISEEHVNSPPHDQVSQPSTQSAPTQSPQKRESSVVTQPIRERYSRAGRKLRVRAPINLFQKWSSNDDADSDGLAPDMQHVAPQQGTPADQPAQMAAVQILEVRYTNYRTAMDNQRLPWAWDGLNKFEIVELRAALKVHADPENAPLSNKQGAFLVWLLLATGQSIEQILNFDLVSSPNSRGALLAGPIYRRYIHTPPHAVRPTEQQKIMFSGHADFIDLLLLPPFPTLVGELGLNNSKNEVVNRHQNIGAYLKLDAEAAERMVRQFLTQHRSRDIRLLPGKIRNVLGTEIMRVSRDPVITHLLSALPTDMPPSGIYYTSYSEEVLQQIYQKAMTRIFGDGS